MKRWSIIWCGWLGLFLCACTTPSINLGTNEPIKVDISMRVDVYQYEADSATAAPASATGSNSIRPAGATPQAAEGATREERRKNRQADIQVFKNSRLIGESREGLLVVLDEPEGDYGDYIRETVERENYDRMEEMKQSSESLKRQLAEIQSEQAKLWINRSFKGEWIEKEKPDGKYQWIQKAE